MRRIWFALPMALVVSVPMGVLTTAAAGAAPSSTSQFPTWTQNEATSASPLLGSTLAQGSHPTTRRALVFTAHVDNLLAKVEQQLGSTFVSAAIDPVAGNVLVVRVTGDAASVRSTALADLETDGGHVRIVEDQPSGASFDAEYQQAAKLVGTRIGDSRILGVARDDMAGRGRGGE